MRERASEEAVGADLRVMERAVENGHDDPAASTAVQLTVGEAHTLALTGACFEDTELGRFCSVWR